MNPEVREYFASITPEQAKAMVREAGQDYDAQVRILIADAKKRGIDLTEEDFRVPPDEPQQAPDGANLCVCVGGGVGELGFLEMCMCVAVGVGTSDEGHSCSCALYGYGA